MATYNYKIQQLPAGDVQDDTLQAEAADIEAPPIVVKTKKSYQQLPLQSIPGSYGLPFLSPIKDRLDYYYNQGELKFFTSRIEKYKSTVFRVNMPPGPFMSSNPKVVTVLDAKSFPVVLDVTKVEKKYLLGTYTPSAKLTGGYRICSYLDPSDNKHTVVKQLLFDLLASRKDQFIPAFRSSYSSLFSTMESQVADSKNSNFNKLNDVTNLDFLGEAYFGKSISATAGSGASTKAVIWILFSLHPLITLDPPKLLRVFEDIFLHTFPLPPFLASFFYKPLYKYFNEAAGPVLDHAVQLGLKRDEACHNLLFATIFNAYGGFKVLFPGILGSLAGVGEKIHARIASEVRQAVRDVGGGKVTLAAVERMELVKSVVYEALRIDPPVKYQYGKAKMDFVIESHDASFQVKKGEMLFGYQPLATRDERVFKDAETYIPDRFVGDEGKKLLQNVFWSNGPETESPTVGNKQCAGKDFAVLTARLLVVEFFIRYDTFTADVSKELLGVNVKVTSLTKATSFTD